MIGYWRFRYDLKERDHMNPSSVETIMPIEFDIRDIHQFVEVMQSYKSQMEMVIAGLDTPGKKQKGTKSFRLSSGLSSN
jgi:hypothetical protein